MNGAVAVILLESFYPPGTSVVRERIDVVAADRPARTITREPGPSETPIKVPPGEVLIEIEAEVAESPSASPSSSPRETQKCTAMIVLEVKRRQRAEVTYRYHRGGRCRIGCADCKLLEVEDDARLIVAQKDAPMSAVLFLERAGLRLQNRLDGVVALAVAPGSPIAQSGLRAEDVITRIGRRDRRGPGSSTEVRTLDDLARFTVQARSYLEISYRRGLTMAKVVLPPATLTPAAAPPDRSGDGPAPRSPPPS